MDVPVRFIDSIINNPLLMQFLVHRWFFLLEYDPRLDQLRVYDTRSRHGTRHIECFSLSRHITASEYEASYAKLEGVNFIFNKKPLEITDKGVVFIDLSEAEDGTLTEIPGTEKLYPADSVIVSISQGPRKVPEKVKQLEPQIAQFQMQMREYEMFERLERMHEGLLITETD